MFFPGIILYYSFVINMLPIQVILFVILIHGFYCNQNCAKIGSTVDGRVKVLIFTNFKWNIETYRARNTGNSTFKTIAHLIRSNIGLKSKEDHDTNSINIKLNCYGEFHVENSILNKATQRAVHCRNNKTEVWNNVQVNFDSSEDMALYYQCNGMMNESILIMLLNGDSNQLAEDINDKIKTAKSIDYPDIEEKFDASSFFDINDNECENYIDGIGCDHFVTLNLELIDFKFSDFLILLFLLLLWLLGLSVCCYDIFKSKGLNVM